MGEPVEIFKALETNSSGTVIHRESFLVDSDYLDEVIESAFPDFVDQADFVENYIPEEEGMAIYEMATDDGEIQNEASYTLGEDEEDYESLLDANSFEDLALDSDEFEDFDIEDDEEVDELDEGFDDLDFDTESLNDEDDIFDN